MNTLQARELAHNLIKEHGLTDWRFYFDNAVRRFGCCYYSKKTITLSKKLTELNSEEKVKDVILHEIAHALVKSGNGHNRIWKQKAISIGCNGHNRIWKQKQYQ